MTIQERIEQLRKQQEQAQTQISEWQAIFMKSAGAIEVLESMLQDDAKQKSESEPEKKA